MRILLLTPGTGNFLCGSCLRDNQLALSLCALGHDAVLAPLYLPFALEEHSRASDSGVAAPPVHDLAIHMGGINVYLQQKLPALRHLPRFVRDRLDSPGLLRFVSRRANMTDASGHGPMTLSMVQGEHGRQREELRRLVEWARTLGRIDAVLLSNVMLAGLARELRVALECPIFSTLQGEAPFLDHLDREHSTRCWAVLGERARELDGVLPVSHYTANLMTERLGLDPARVHVVWNGIDLEGFAPPNLEGLERAAGGPTIGYVARMCRDKGLPLLLDAFERVKAELPTARLVAAGAVWNEDRALVEELRARVVERGFGADVELVGPVSRDAKLALLRRCDVFSVPACYGESFGLYLLEAWASGVPCVQPRHGAFPELLEATGGGLLVEPNDSAALAEGLLTLLRDPDRARQLGAGAATVVAERLHATQMARDVARVLAGT